MIRKRPVMMLLTSTAVAAMTLTMASTASADLTTRCVGEGGAVTIPTDLVVPNGRICVLDGTVIQGDVRVGRDADLIIENGMIDGRVVAASNAYFETYETEVTGRILLRSAFGTFLGESDLGGDVVSRPAPGDDVAGFVLTDGVESDGRVVVDAGELLLDTSEVAGDVIARDSLYADVYDSFIDGGLRSLRNEQGSVVCKSAIQGEARFAGNPFAVQLGGDTPLVECDGSSYWASDVYAVNNTGGVYLDDNIANGDVILLNNDPVAQVGDGNLVRGDVIGDFEAMASSSAAKLTVKSLDARVAESVAERGDALERKVDSRRADALDAAEAAGDAF